MENKQSYIEKFKELYKAKNGQEISDADALAHFEHLITLVSAIYKPISLSVFENQQCPLCLEKVNHEDFVDLESKHEFLVSGLCQICIDKIFHQKWI